jgi:hypothetical protein
MGGNYRAKYGREATLFRTYAELKECFLGNSECSKEIIRAHSLQENGYLNKIAADVKGNRSLYSLGQYSKEEESSLISFKPQGLNASTFWGFCSYHDNAVFKPIEGEHKFDSSTEHCFLHSFRAFAHFFHKIKEQHKFFKVVPEVNEEIPALLKYHKLQTHSILEEGKFIRQELIELWEAKKFDGLQYSIVSHKIFLPIAAAFAFFIPYSYNEIPMFIANGMHAKLLMLTILPDETGTIVLLAGFKNCPFSRLFIDEFESLDEEEKNDWITFLILTRGEVNTHFSPNLLQAMDENELKQFMKLLDHFSFSINRPRSYYYLGSLFEPKFAIR